MRRVNLSEAIALMTIEAAALKPKTSMLIYFMALRARDIWERRVLEKRRESRRRIWSGVKTDLLLAAIPSQIESVHTGSHFNYGMEHIGKRLPLLNRLPVQLQLSRRCCRDNVRLIIGQGRAIDRTHDLSSVLIRGGKNPARESEKQRNRDRAEDLPPARVAQHQDRALHISHDHTAGSERYNKESINGRNKLAKLAGLYN